MQEVPDFTVSTDMRGHIVSDAILGLISTADTICG
jgi:hypothetical protein